MENARMVVKTKTTVVEQSAVADEKPALHLLNQQEPDCRYVHKPVYEAVKRALDVALSVVGLILASPILLITAIAIKCEDGGAVFHKRMCIGKGRKPYVMYKFRSMVPNADDLDHLLTKEQKEQYKREVKIDDDPRVTKTGRFIRKTSIDELPQFFSVLRGDMSLVGPRPMVEFENQHFNEYADFVLLVLPGITGYWQVYGRNHAKYEDGERQRMEVYYVQNRSLWFDFKLLVKTVGCVFRCNGN